MGSAYKKVGCFMSLAFAQYLQDFGSSSGLPQLTMMPEIARSDALPIVEVSVDVEAEKAVSYQEGYSAATQTLSEEHAAQLEALAQSHRDALVKKEDEINTRVSQVLISELASQIDQVSGAIKSEVSTIMMQLIEEDLVRKSIEQLDEIIKNTLKDNSSSQIEIFGPNILLTKIKEELGDESNHINLVETEDVDLTIEIDKSILKTRLFEWCHNFGDKQS